MTQEELALAVGYKSRSTINKIEKGLRDINQSQIMKFAEALRTSPGYLMGWETQELNVFDFENIKPIKTKKFRMLGDIACGEPIYANEEYDVYIEASEDINADYCLRAKGDSMINANIFDGDIVFIKEQEEIPNGKIAAVLIEDEVLLKRFYKTEDTITLISENPAYEPRTYNKSDMLNIRILGRAVVVQSLVK